MDEQAAAAPTPPSTQPGIMQGKWPSREKPSRFSLATTEVVPWTAARRAPPPLPDAGDAERSPAVRRPPHTDGSFGSADSVGRFSKSRWQPLSGPAESGECGTPVGTRPERKPAPETPRNLGLGRPPLTTRHPQRLRQFPPPEVTRGGNGVWEGPRRSRGV